MSKRWPTTKKVLNSSSPAKSMWSEALLQTPVAIHQIPASFDKIKENCGALSAWWFGTRLEKKQIDTCVINDTLDFDCVKDIFNKISREIDIKPAGSGQYGATFMACKLGSCDYVLKIQMADDSFRREVYALYDLNGWKYSPTIYDAWTCGGVGFMIIEKMESLKNCVARLDKSEVRKQVDTMLNELRDKEWFHIDIKAGNIMCKQGHLALIDFGMAVKIPKGPLKYVLNKHPTVLNDKKPMKRAMIAEFEDEIKEDAIDEIYSIVSKPRKQLKKGINTVMAGVKLSRKH